MDGARDDAALMARLYDRHDLYDRQLGGRRPG
jgi:hypothetical protein